jgi:WD40 repeat protein
VATGGDDATVKIWGFDGHTLTPVTTLSLPVDANNYAYGFLSFSPDGKYLAAGGVGAVMVYNVPGFTSASSPLTISQSALGVGFAPDSRHIVSVDADTLYVHVIGTPTAVATAAIADYVDTLAVSPVAGAGGATTIVVGGTTYYYTAEAEIFTFSGTTLTGPVLLDLETTSANAIFSSSFTADGTQVALGDYISEVWVTGLPSTDQTLTTATLLSDPLMYSDVRALAYSPANANYLALGTGVTSSGQYGILSIWNVPAKSPIARFTSLNQTPQSVAFSPGGNAVVLGEAGCGRVLLCTN